MTAVNRARSKEKNRKKVQNEEKGDEQNTEKSRKQKMINANRHTNAITTRHQVKKLHSNEEGGMTSHCEIEENAQKWERREENCKPALRPSPKEKQHHWDRCQKKNPKPSSQKKRDQMLAGAQSVTRSQLRRNTVWKQGMVQNSDTIRA